MSTFKTKFNPFTKKLQWVLDGTLITFKEGVATESALPSSGNTENDARITNDTGHLYIWDGTSWIDQGDILDITWDAIEGKPSSTPAQIDDAVDKKHTKALNGIVAPTLITPEYIGQLYIDTVNNINYISNGLTQGDWEELGGGAQSQYVTVGTSGADYDNFDDAIDYLRTLNGGRIIVTTDMVITSTAVKDISHIQIEGCQFYAGTRKISKTVNGGYWHGKNVYIKDISFNRMADIGANEIFRFTEDYQDVLLEWVSCIGFGAPFNSPKVFNINGFEAHILTKGNCLLGAEAMTWHPFLNPLKLVLHIYDRTGFYGASDTFDACFMTDSTVIEGTPIFTTPGHPVKINKASGMDNDSSVSGDTVKDALENLEALFGIVAPTLVTPIYIGQIYRDTVNDKTYIAKSLVQGDWEELGGGGSVDWSGITNKPTSNVEDIDDAVDKKHEQNTDTKLAEGTINEVTASELIKNISNTVLLAFQIAVLASITIYEMIDGFVDTYLDETGIDIVNSINESHNVVDNYYEPTQNADYKLILHLNGSDGDTITTDESSSEHAVTFHGDAELDTDYKKFGTSSLLLEGSGSFLSMPNSDDFDIVIDNIQSQTISMWIRPSDLISADRPFIAFYSAPNDWWSFYHSRHLGLHFVVRTAGVTQIVASDINSFGSLTINNWHHIALVIKGNGVTKDIGIYVDGIQQVYKQSAFTHNYGASIARIGSTTGELTANFLGHIDDAVLINGNYFSASPNSEKTDTIIVPTTEIMYSSNMTLISNAQIADAEPDKARIIISEEDVDAIILNTDIKAYISKDNGATWAEATWAIEEVFGGVERVFVGSADLSVSGIGSGTDMVYKIETLNDKDLKIHSTALLWD